MTAYIYGLYDPRNGNLRYIGKTNNLQKRFYGHNLEKGTNHKHHWINGLKEQGLKPEMRVIETIENSNDLDWQEREIYWIKKSLDDGHPLTNLDSGGKSGMKKSQETSERIARANTGKKRSEETRLRISQSKSNPSQETRDRIRASKLGIMQSEETKRKRAESLRGKKRSPETRLLLSQRRRATVERKSLENPPKEKTLKGHKNRPAISEETRQKLRDSHKGKKQSPETIAKRVAGRIGVPRSEETKQKIRLGHLGKPKPRKNKL